MRSFVLSMVLIMGATSVAFAQNAVTAAESLAPNASAVSAPPSVAVAPAMPTAVVDEPKGATATSAPSTEPNLKGIKGSGGKVTSSIITDAPLASDFVQGDPKASLVMVEYVSMTCPHCAHFTNAVMPEVEKNYIKTGKIRYVLRQFPLNEPALKAAMLLDCVGAQDEKRYYTFVKVLFDAQNKWAFEMNFLDALQTIATVGGLTKDQFQNCVNNTDRETRLLKAKKTATDELKIPHTPYIIIGDEIYAGERDYDSVAKFIDEKLAKSKNKSWLPKL